MTTKSSYGHCSFAKKTLSFILLLFVLAAALPLAYAPFNALNDISFAASDASLNGITASATFNLVSPQPAETSIEAYINLTGTAKKTGKYTISLTSETMGDITSPESNVFHVVRGQVLDAADVITYSFSLPNENVEDLRIGLEFTPELEVIAAKSGYNLYRMNLLNPQASVSMNSTSGSFMNSGDLYNNKFYYTCGTAQIFGTVDIDTGEISTIKTETNYGLIAYNPVDGLMYAMPSGYSNALYTIDPETGDETKVVDMDPTTNFILSFVITNDGRFIAINSNDETISELNPETGELTVLIQMNYNINYGQDLAINRRTNTVYWASCSYEAEYNLYELDLTHNTATILFALTGQTTCVEIIPYDELTITEQPEASISTSTDTEDTIQLTVAATSEYEAAISYQWYSCDNADGANPLEIEGAESATYTVSTSDYGTYYYYCELTTQSRGYVTSDISTVTVACAHVNNEDDGDCTTEVTCSICDEVVIEAKAHSWSDEYSYDIDNHWKICENENCTVRNNEGAHTMVGGEVITPATIFAAGSKQVLCSACGYETTGIIARIIANPSNLPYEDVDDDKWYTNAVAFAVNHDYMYGISNTYFGVDDNLTRAEAVYILARICGDDLSDYWDETFDDVPSTEWYHKSVEWAADYGITSGTGGNLFSPNASIPREQMALMIYKTAVLTGMSGEISGNISSYSDHESVSAWAVTAVTWCVENGYMTGTEDNRIAPKDMTTRAHIAVMLMNLFAQR